MIIVLDTNTYSQWLRDGEWAEEIGAASLVVMPAPVLGELREGFLKGTRAELNEKKLKNFLANSLVAIANVGAETSHHYARFKNELRKRGRPIPVNDIWIAAISYEVGGTLLTGDGHFREIAGLKVVFPRSD